MSSPQTGKMEPRPLCYPTAQLRQAIFMSVRNHITR
jgi:hypothetical protein